MSKTLFERVKSKIPSRNTLIFWGSVVSLASYRYYNKSECKKQMERVKSQASVLANVPMAPNEIPKKVRIIITNQPGEFTVESTRKYWEKYIMPVFFAGALDYEIVEFENYKKGQDNLNENGLGVMEGLVHEYVCDLIKKQIRTKIESDHPELKQIRENAQAPQQDTNISDSLPETWKKPDDGILDIIAFGRNTLAETFNGIVEGSSTSLNLSIKKPTTPEIISPAETPDDSTVPATQLENRSSEVTLASEEFSALKPQDAAIKAQAEDQVEAQAEDQVEAQAEAQAEDEDAIVIDYDSYDKKESREPLPALGFIPIKARAGMSSIPGSISRFFNDNEYTKFYSELALKIVLDHKRKWNHEADTKLDIQDENSKGWGGKHAVFLDNSDISNNLYIYDTN